MNMKLIRPNSRKESENLLNHCQKMRVPPEMRIQVLIPTENEIKRPSRSQFRAENMRSKADTYAGFSFFRQTVCQ